MIKRIQPRAVPESQAPFSQVVVDDQYAFLAGLVAADFPAGVAVLGDVADETRTVLNVIREVLLELNLAMNQIVRVDVHLVNLDDFDAMDKAYREYFEEDQFPARTTTESKKLFGGSLVEITCQARLIE